MVGFYSGAPIDSDAEQAQGTDLIPATTGQVLGADVDTGAAETPIARIDDWLTRTYEGAGQAPMTADEANARYGIKGDLSFSKPVTDAVASALHDDKQAELMRQDTIARGSGGLVQSVGGFGARLLPQFFDPLNVASAFVPGLGEARAAAILGRAGIESGLAARVVAGATQGALGQAALEPLNFALDRADHEDWSMGSALSDVAFGGLLGGGIHVLTGLRGAADARVLSDIGAETTTMPGEAAEGVIHPPPESTADLPVEPAANPITDAMEAAGPLARDAALREAVGAMAEDRPNNVSEGLGAAAESDALGNAYDSVLRQPIGPANDPLVRIQPEDMEGLSVSRGGSPNMNEMEVRGGGYGLVKFIWRHGQMSDKPVTSQIIRNDVTSFPDVIRSFDPIPAPLGASRTWRVDLPGPTGVTRPVTFGESRFGDGNNRLVTVHVDDLGGPKSLPREGANPPGGFAAPPGDTAAGLSISDAGSPRTDIALSTLRRNFSEDTPDVAAARRSADSIAQQAPRVEATQPDAALAEAQAAHDKVQAMIEASGDDDLKTAAAKLDEDDKLADGLDNAREAIGGCLAARL